MGLIEIVVLAIVQGLTEFLPVSSSGHLVIGVWLFAGTTNPSDVVEVEIVLHAGTLVSILVFYWGRICRLLGEDRRLVGLLLLATLPAVLVGLPLKAFGTALLSNPLLAGCLLPVTGLILLAIPRLPPGKTPYRELTCRGALWIGIAQALAILPGLSRSGTTITAGLAGGLSRPSAATFSFLLAIPAIAGGTVLHIKDLVTEGTGGTPLPYLAVGALISFAVGLVALWWVVRWLEQGRLHYFAWWCIPLGSAVVIWQLVVIFS